MFKELERIGKKKEKEEKMSYQRLGDYIREVNVRNRELKVTNLLGVSISKEFIPSIANTIGTDKSKYTDWANRSDIKAELQMDLILILAEHGYPPVPQDEVFKEIFEQAENFKKYDTAEYEEEVVRAPRIGNRTNSYLTDSKDNYNWMAAEPPTSLLSE